jgi:RNA polymerase sigma-70 factor, ECF subfamily
VSDGHDFDAIFRETGPRLWRALLAYAAGRRDVADDALAEAFARAIERGNAVRDPASYLYRIAFRVAAAELRRPAPSDPVVSGVDPDPGLAELFGMGGGGG